MEDLKDWLERTIDERMKKLGFTVETPQKEEDGATQKTVTITFVNGERARRMKEFYKKQKGKK
jgi:hypothetical protein